MFVAGNALTAVATILDYVLWLYMWVIIARALISWVNPDPWNPIVQFLNRATEPVLCSDSTDDRDADRNGCVAHRRDSDHYFSADRRCAVTQGIGHEDELRWPWGMP